MARSIWPLTALTRNKTIVIGWVNDFDTLRAYGSKTDAYKVFATKLKAGDPPDSWE
ncbi:type II toxin-antitoxin system YhaV family toxin [Serratia plymuthica]|uniref:type II toxin-antitoxin system YhaV family toxin n=1 Tax=Serratia plymuthica TaxID=82996 RepID=UPI0021B82518|nr:type II toxin-antitoxin system YhaV family toxin [Serratia plymuthica]